MYHTFKPQNISILIFVLLHCFPYLNISGGNYLSFQASENKSAVQSKIVAKIGNIAISEDEFISSYEFGPAFVKRGADSKLKHLNYMINEKLLALYGYEVKIDTLEQVMEYYEAIKNDLMTEELYKKDILENIEITEDEIREVMDQKQLELEIRWIFTNEENQIQEIVKQLKTGSDFDSLYLTQFSDSVFLDDRSLLTTRYRLGLRNQALANIIDTLKIGAISEPYNFGEGWYIFKIHNVIRNLITTESETEKLKHEAVAAVKKNKMDSLSDLYVNNLMLSYNPVIKRPAFNVLRSFLGKFVLPAEKYSAWKLEDILNNTINNEKIKQENINQQILVELKNSKVTLNDFLVWYRTRDNYIKFSEGDIKSFSKSIEQVIWRMIRDKLLTELAYSRGLDQNEYIRNQLKWWKDKIVYGAVRNDLVNSIMLNSDEISDKTETQYDAEGSEFNAELELRAKIFRLLKEKKEENQVYIDTDYLKKISVSSEEDPKAIDFYTVKKGGLIPRTPFPTIDFGWRAWE